MREMKRAIAIVAGIIVASSVAAFYAIGLTDNYTGASPRGTAFVAILPSIIAFILLASQIMVDAPRLPLKANTLLAMACIAIQAFMLFIQSFAMLVL